MDAQLVEGIVYEVGMDAQLVEGVVYEVGMDARLVEGIAYRDRRSSICPSLSRTS